MPTCAPHFFALDVPSAVADADAAAAVYTAHVAAGDADHRGFHGNVGDSFGLFHSATNGTDGGIEVDDQAFAQPFRFGGAQREKPHLLFVDLGDQGARFHAADIQPD